MNYFTVIPKQQILARAKYRPEAKAALVLRTGAAWRIVKQIYVGGIRKDPISVFSGNLEQYIRLNESLNKVVGGWKCYSKFAGDIIDVNNGPLKQTFEQY